MKTLVIVFALLAAIQLVAGHIVPCSRVDQRAQSAADKGNYIEAVRIPERLLLREPCLCREAAQSAVVAAFVYAAGRILEEPEPDLRAAANLESHFRTAARRHEIEHDGRVQQTFAELRVRQIDRARAESQAGKHASALRLLDELAAAYHDGETQGRVRREQAVIGVRYAQALAREDRLEEAVSQLSLVVRNADAPVRIREHAERLAATTMGTIVRSHIKARDVAAAWSVVERLRIDFPGATGAELLDYVDTEIFGRPLRMGAVAPALDDRDRAGRPVPGAAAVELRILNATGVKLGVVLRGSTRMEITVPQGGQAASSTTWATERVCSISRTTRLTAPMSDFA